MIAIVVSRADSASEHIGEQLLDAAEWTAHEDETRPESEGGGRFFRRQGFEYRAFDALHLDIDGAADAFDDPDLLLFVSRHSGETGPLLSAHFTGNFGPAEYGGEDGALARACPEAQKAVVAALTEHAPDGYEVGIECTHHGPSAVGVPSMFVELGSGPDEWDDPEGARAVARAVLDIEGVGADRLDGGVERVSDGASGDGDHDSVATPTDRRTRHVVGFGGGHYAPRFGRILGETDWAVGHVGADWPLEAMGHPAENRDVIRRAFEASAADLAVVDGDRPALERVVADLGYRVVSETFLRVTEGVDRSLVDRLEADLCAVEAGLRFGRLGRSDEQADGERAAQYVVRSLPTALLERALGVDETAARAAVADAAVAFETSENGTRPSGRVALPPGTGDEGAERDEGEERDEGDDAGYDRLVEGLCDVLRNRYDEVRREGDVVVARERAFDPAAARERGVPEGPAFGQLSRGEAVEVDGETVDPASVHRERTDRFTV